MPPASQYDLMFSMVHPEPEKRDVKWNIREAISGELDFYFLGFPLNVIMETILINGNLGNAALFRSPGSYVGFPCTSNFISHKVPVAVFSSP